MYDEHTINKNTWNNDHCMPSWKLLLLFLETNNLELQFAIIWHELTMLCDFLYLFPWVNVVIILFFLCINWKLSSTKLYWTIVIIFYSQTLITLIYQKLNTMGFNYYILQIGYHRCIIPWKAINMQQLYNPYWNAKNY